MSFFVVLATSLKSSASKTALPKLNTTANTRTLQSYGESSSSLRNNSITPLASLALNKPVTKSKEAASYIKSEYRKPVKVGSEFFGLH
ncbi:hypothetical protein ACHWQZ_G008576 [Mnemiopsis leidyi]